MYFTTFATFAAAITVPATIKPIAAAHFAIFHADGSAITGNVVFSSKLTTCVKIFSLTSS